MVQIWTGPPLQFLGALLGKKLAAVGDEALQLLFAVLFVFDHPTPGDVASDGKFDGVEALSPRLFSHGPSARFPVGDAHSDDDPSGAQRGEGLRGVVLDVDLQCSKGQSWVEQAGCLERGCALGYPASETDFQAH